MFRFGATGSGAGLEPPPLLGEFVPGPEEPVPVDVAPLPGSLPPSVCVKIKSLTPSVRGALFLPLLIRTVQRNLESSVGNPTLGPL